jgi:hypothetical protein
MPGIADYPTPSVNPSNPKIDYFQELPTEYKVLEQVFEDQGADYALDATTGVRKFVIGYNSLTEAEAAILDTHYNLAKGKFTGFQITIPRTGEIVNDVHYFDFDYPGHEKKWSQKRKVVLIKRPGA